HDPTAIIVRYGRIDAAAIAAAPSLRVVSKHGAGADTIDKTAAAARDIDVVAAAGANAAAVAEHTLALLLACAKSVPQLDQRMRAGHWDKSTHKSVELGGRTIGLVGLGAIGVRFARMVDAMDMRVIGFDPYANDVPRFVERVDELDAIWRESDVVSLHCPLTADNAGMVDADALLAALRSGQVAAAGLDSFAVEPLPAEHPFRAEPRIVLSPHIGGVTADAYVAMGVGAAKNVLASLAARAR